MKTEATSTVLITGGAGFIGSNLAAHLLEKPGTRVKILDNLARPGVKRNLDWLLFHNRHGNLEFIQADVRDADAVNRAVAGVSEIYHFAAQTAVTCSVADPVTDFQVNALGTLNILEAARHAKSRPFLLFASTHKVYGALTSIPLVKEGAHYRTKTREFDGVSEAQVLDFHSPYVCSKGAAEQYVRDYGRTYEIPTVVLRMSSIAGPRQFGNEDQGWVAHLLYSALAGKPVTLHGDGLQVRDVLHVRDLIEAILAVRKNLQLTRGKVYNVGGGALRAVSVLEVIHTIEKRLGKRISLQRRPSRPGDQPLYISDTSRLTYDSGWHPRLRLAQVLDDLHAFWRENLDHRRIPVQSAAPPLAAFEEVA